MITLESGSYWMKSFTPNAVQGDLTKPVTGKSDDVETLANHLAAREELKAAIEGLKHLAREKAAAKDPQQAA
jgi:hypothetical protein